MFCAGLGLSSGGSGDDAGMPPSERVAALLVRLQHLWTENQFLRERVRMVEAEAQPLLTELSEKREGRPSARFARM